jgi:beta-galactosidase
MKKIRLLFFIFSMITGIGFAQQNDHIFPPAAPAKKYIDFDRQGFIINGKKTFLVSAGMEYARIPHELWPDRLMRLKRAGFNCIEIYTFWNFHEPLEGRFEFSGDHDLDAFLKLVKKLDMYAIVRVGPYYCAEWDFGGYPIWLHFKDNLVAREPNAEFEKYTDRFFDRLIPIVSTNQINHGGAVILVQLENEHDAGWGTVVPNAYFSHLQNKALSLGLQVPYFFSGLHHGGNPAGNGTKAFDDPTRPNPWFTTEFWAVWYNYYGSSQKDADEFGRRTWKIIAHGGGGYNYYMAHGGSNFGYTNSDEDAASYDYGAAVGQTGDLRPVYYQFKRNALFARSFENILCNAIDASSSYQEIASDTQVHTYARHSNSGDLIFLDNFHKNEETLKVNIDNKQLPTDGNITLAPGEIMPLVKTYTFATGITLDWAVCRVLGTSVQENTHTIVVYGPPGSKGELQFSSENDIHIITGGTAFTMGTKTVGLKITFNDHQPELYRFKSGPVTIEVIAVNTTLADRTWFAVLNHKEYIVTGPEYLSDITIENNRLQLTTEHFWAQDQQFPVWVYGSDTVKNINISATPNVVHPRELALDKWQVSNASAAASPGFDDSKWLKSETALQMGADGDLSCYAWYRTNFQVNSEGDYTLRIRNGGDTAVVYIDDIRSAANKIPGNIILPKLTPGRHSMAIFIAHNGRNKLYNYYGPLKYRDAKGLSGDLILQKDKSSYLTNWKMMIAAGDSALDIPSFDGASFYKSGDDAFDKRKGSRWMQATIPVEDNLIPAALYVRDLPAKSAIFINGKQVLLPDDGAPGHLIPVSGLLKPSENNTLTILIENQYEGRKLSVSPVEVVINHQADIRLSDWRMQGGPGDPAIINNWKPLQTSDSFDRPQFYSNTFNVPETGMSRVMWRVTFEGLGHGSVWVNGHNLGRYPEKIPVKSLYIPECWLQRGVNHLTIYDEDGNKPDKVSIQAEQGSSRDLINLTL